jgi:DNA polymerase III subunit beta
VRLERKQLVNGLERLAVLTDRDRVVFARVNQPEQSVTLTVETADLGSGFETLEAQIAGESLEIGLNIKYLLEGLKKLDTAWVQLQMNAPTNPVIVSPVESLIPTTQVLMPIEIH